LLFCRSIDEYVVSFSNRKEYDPASENCKEDYPRPQFSRRRKGIEDTQPKVDLNKCNNYLFDKK
jgi:hypothetical protein